jgi:hypothetical protein
MLAVFEINALGIILNLLKPAVLITPKLRGLQTEYYFMQQ